MLCKQMKSCKMMKCTPKCGGYLAEIFPGRRRSGARAWGRGSNPPSWDTAKDSVRPIWM